MRHEDQFVAFALDEQRYALALATVERVVRAVEITPLPKAPEIVSGVINVQGRIVPVVDIRRRFHLLKREPSLTDQLIVAHTVRRPVALSVDAVTGLIECFDKQAVEARHIVPGIEYVEGVLKLADGLILVHDLDKFLSLDEETDLDRAMKGE